MATHPPFPPIVCIVDFHHARGPEVEKWIGVPEDSDPAVENDWPLLPFQALSDGAHTATEDFSYFTLRHESTPDAPATSLFGISCTRQLDANSLINRPPDVTRSTVQKAVVVISDSPQHFAHLREKLSVVTKAWFAQCDFTDLDILQRFQESLGKTFADREHERDQYFGLSLRELIHEFKHQALVLFKACLLQPKDTADPQFNSYEENMKMPTSLKTSERASLLAYMGLPLQLFGKGSLFGPYTPLQQLDMLADRETKSYIVGSTNSLLLQQKDRYSDILINLDDNTLNISSIPLRNALGLTTPDRRWIDFLTQQVNDTWDEKNPERPITLGYAGSEESIRLQFEEYLLALLASAKYRLYQESQKENPKSPVFNEIEGDPAAEFGNEFINAWMKTENFRIFNKFTDGHLFDIVVPEHPCSGGLTIEDVQRRFNAQVESLHLDERLARSKETVNKHLSEGQKKVSTAYNKLWADIEAMREAQRKKAEEDQKAAAEKAAATEQAAKEKEGKGSPASSISDKTAQSTGDSAKSRASSYFSSWGQWASEKRAGWRKNPGTPTTPTTPVPASPIDSKKSLESALEEKREDGIGHKDGANADEKEGTSKDEQPAHDEVKVESVWSAGDDDDDDDRYDHGGNIDMQTHERKSQEQTEAEHNPWAEAKA